MSDLLPCPFCGSDAEYHSDKGPTGEVYGWVGCNQCDAMSVQCDVRSMQPEEPHPIDAWNTRVTSKHLSMTDTNAVVALIADAVSDSLGPDWTAFDAAHHVMQWLTDEGLCITKAPARGTDCPASHNGFHHVDTSMESGPNNCFHCERPM